MASIKTVDRIIEILRNSNLSWLLPNLRQDFLVWNNLNDPEFYDKFILSIPAGTVFAASDFAPARLALLALGQSTCGETDPQHLFSSVDQQLVQAAVRSYSDQAILRTYPQDLPGAGMIALALAFKHHGSNSWVELINTLPSTDYLIWSAPFACLLGLIDNPFGLLSALVQPGCYPVRFKLAIHALLSNPIPPQEQVEILMGLCSGQHGDLLPPTDRLTLIDELYEQRPQLAEEFCARWLDAHIELSGGIVTTHMSTAKKIEQMAEILFHIKVREISGDISLPEALQSAEQTFFHSLSTDLAGRIYTHRTTERLDIESKSESLDPAEQAVQISQLTMDPAHPSTEQAELALLLLDQGHPEEANLLLPQLNEPLTEHVDILYAMAKLAFQSGDVQRSVNLVSRIMKLLEHQASIATVPVWGDYFSQVNLGKLLFGLHKPVEAANVFEFALRTCPDDTRLLKMLAESYQAANQDKHASEAYHALVSLNPQDLDYRRLLANSLADIGEWEACLNERDIIITSDQGNLQSLPIDDFYAYAQCALKANQPQLALKVSTELLAKDQDDTQALIYTGEAHLQMNSIDQGVEFLVRATQGSNQLSEAWLALAEAQQKIYPRATVIETLKNGAQAIPGCSEIYFTLGNLYLQDNAPTLAMPNLRSAVELSPANPAILISYGQALELLGHLAEAREVLSRAYGIEPEFPGLAQRLARLLLESGDLEGAISPLERLINNKTPHEPAVYLDYARCVLTLNKRGSVTNPPMKALIALNEVLQIDPEHAEAKALTAEALAAGGENQLAFQAYREALDTPLTEDNAWRERLSYGFGCIASSIGKYDIAIAALQDASQSNPNNPAIYIALSEAYLSANLPEDALRSAHSALVVDGDNPDSLAWFARHMEKIMAGASLDGSYPTLALSKQLPSEALTALGKAIQLAPTRTDLLIQLGHLQSSIGIEEEAKATFASIAAFDFATTADLLEAAQYLSSIHDHSAAIVCLEKGVSLDQAGSAKHIPYLYTFLAREYVNNHDHASAIDILDKAIDLIPDDCSLLSSKVDILLGLNQCMDAFRCIETAVKKANDSQLDTDLLLLASRINLSMGDFDTAIKYARMCAVPTHKQGVKNNLAGLTIRQQTQIAELYRSLLQPHQAYQILQGRSKPAATDFRDEQDYLDYVCLQTELALETGEPIMPGIEDIQVADPHPSYSRLMAIKSRLLNLAGNSSQAEQVYEIALRSLNTSVNADSLSSWDAPIATYINTVSVIEAALDCGSWKQAADLTQRILGACAGAPLPHLQLARAIILKAEFNHLCEIFEVSAHKPSMDSHASENLKLAYQYIDQAHSILEPHQGEPIAAEHAVTYDQIYRWRARAGIIFEQDDAAGADDREILAQQPTGADSAALILHLHHLTVLDPGSDALSRIIRLARTNPRNPAVILQVALALQEGNPIDAMRALQSVLQQNPFSQNPTTAFCQILLARIGLKLKDYTAAQGAVEAAIDYWPDEPFWHAFASQIYQRTADLCTAANHLSAAAKLDPENISYHLDLGKLYLDSAHEDMRMLHLAQNCFERVLELEQNEVSALINLAATQWLMHDLENSNENARKALVLAPNRADIYQLLSEIAVSGDDYQGAYEYANKAILINPRDIQSTVVLVKSLSALGRYDEALTKLNAAIPAAQQSMPLYLERVNIMQKKDGPRAALSELIGLTRTFPDDFTILNALSRCYIEVGEPDSAVLAAQHALKICTEQTSKNDQANLHLMIGQILRLSGQLDQSIQHLNEAIQLAPDRLEPYLELGLARKERREYQQALQIFEHATIIAPDDPRAPYQAGLALKESKDYKSSETMLRKAVSLAPNDLNIRRQLAAVVALNLVHNPRAGRY